jgi:glutamate carboxypeptidase
MNRFAPDLGWIASQREAMLERVETWSAINTGTFNVEGIVRLTHVIAPLFEKIGATSSPAPLETYQAINDDGLPHARPLADAVIFRRRPEAPVRLLLAIHLDTVYARDHAFQTPTRLDSLTLRGPGVADAKGGLAVMLTALEVLERSEWAPHVGWTVVLNTDEEIGSPGSGALLTREAATHHAGLVFEPCLPDGALVSHRKGSGNYSLVIHGRSAHAGRDVGDGRNALHVMAETIVAINAWQTGAASGGTPGLTVNVGRVVGGGPVNVVPDLAVCHFNLRVPDADTQRRLQRELQQLVDGLNQRDGFHATLHGSFTAPPKPLDANTAALLEQITQCGEAIGLNLGQRGSGGVCDGNRLAAAGLPTIDTLGPCGGNIHSPEEFVMIDSLTQRASLVALLLLRYAVGDLVPPVPPVSPQR